MYTSTSAVLSPVKVAERLRQDSRLVVVDRTNLRYLKLQDLPDEACPVNLVSLDLSFISVLKVMPVVCDVLRPGGKLIVLIKPQFEASRDQVSQPLHALLYVLHVIWTGKVQPAVLLPTQVAYLADL